MTTALWVQLSGFWIMTVALGIAGLVFAWPGPLRTASRDRVMGLVVALTVTGLVVYGAGVMLT